MSIWRAFVSCFVSVLFPLHAYRYGQEFRQLLARAPDDKTKYKDHETLLSFYTEDVMRAAEREVRFTFHIETSTSTYFVSHYCRPFLLEAAVCEDWGSLNHLTVYGSSGTFALGHVCPCWSRAWGVFERERALIPSNKVPHPSG